MKLAIIGLGRMGRNMSQGRDDYTSRLLAMMRHPFGGHTVTKAS